MRIRLFFPLMLGGAIWALSSSGAQAQEVIKLAGCGSETVEAERSPSGWLAKLGEQPTRNNWRAALTDWTDSKKRDDFHCLMIFRLQNVSGSYRLEPEKIAVRYLKDEYVNRPPDWFSHAMTASDHGLPGEGLAVIEERRHANDKFAFGASVYELYRQLEGRHEDDKSTSPILPYDPVTSSWTSQRLAGEGRFWLTLGNYGRAAAFFERANKGTDFKVRVELERGYALYRAGDPTQAELAFRRVQAKGSSVESEVAGFWLAFIEHGAR